MASLQNQFEELRLQSKLGKQNFHEVEKKFYEPLDDTLEDTSRYITKILTETSIVSNKALKILNDNGLEKTNDGGKLASQLMSPLSRILNSEHISQFKLLKDPSSNRVKDLLINKTIPVALHNILLTFCDTDKIFELQGCLLKMITNNIYNVGVPILRD